MGEVEQSLLILEFVRGEAVATLIPQIGSFAMMLSVAGRVAVSAAVTGRMFFASSLNDFGQNDARAGIDSVSIRDVFKLRSLAGRIPRVDGLRSNADR
jgi:hypothetical protein